jgi:hypothetical protein
MKSYIRLIAGAFILLMISFWRPTEAFAYYSATGLEYYWDSDEIGGFSGTWMEPWDDPDVWQCVDWEWDWYYEEYVCVAYNELQFGPAVAGALYAPNEEFRGGGFAGGVWWSGALVGYWSGSGGTGYWTALGNHYVIRDWYYWYWDDYWERWDWQLVSAGELFSAWPTPQTGLQISNACSLSYRDATGNQTLTMMVSEYRSQGIGWIPHCEDFRYWLDNGNGENSVYFGWSDFANEHDYPYFALIGWPLEVGVDQIQEAWSNLGNGTLYTNSGYRSPIHNCCHISPAGAANSRHLFGDAMDFASNSTTWQDLHDTAKSRSPVPCVEPLAISMEGHVHADYRLVEGVFNRINAPGCPANW